MKEGCTDRGSSVLTSIGWAVLRLEKTLKEDQQWQNSTPPEDRAREISELCDLEDDDAVTSRQLLECVQNRLQQRETVDLQPRDEYL